MTAADSRNRWRRRATGAFPVQAIAIVGVIVALLLWGWLDVGRRALPQHGQMTDLTVYLPAARALAAGQDIYAVRGERLWPYLYPPLTALMFVPLSHLSQGVAAYAWFLVSVGALGASVGLVRATLRIAGNTAAVHPQVSLTAVSRVGHPGTGALPAPSKAAFIGLAMVALPAVHTLQRGQVNCIVLLFACAAIYAWARRWDVLSGASLGMAAAVKVTPGFAVIYFLYLWVRGQAVAMRGGAWRPTTLLRGSAAPIGFAAGLMLGIYGIPALYTGPARAATLVSTWRTKVAAGYITANAGERLFAGARGIHEINDKNQSWYRVVIGYVQLADPQALARRNELRPEWKGRVWWVLLGLGATLTGTLLWLSRSDGDRRDVVSYAALAAFVWLGISLGEIAWSHFYVMVYPLAAVAWFVSELAGYRLYGRLVRAVFLAVALAYIVHYALFVPTGLGRYGTLLIPTTLLAIVTLLGARWVRRSSGQSEGVVANDRGGHPKSDPGGNLTPQR